MIRELVAYGHSINECFHPWGDLEVACSPLLSHPQSSCHDLDLPRHFLDLCYRLDCALRRMPLLGKPLCNVRLSALKPRVDQNVVVYTAAMLYRGGGARDLEQPGRIGV